MATKKPTSSKRPPKSPRPTAAAASDANVRVRMYRQGLGDCFLLIFGPDAAAKYVLIDCGTLGNSQNKKNSIENVVANIAETTNKHLDLLIATHEHKDHISGFGSQQKVFDGFQIDNVWMAWTEDPSDELAKQLAKDRRDLTAALTAVARSPAAGGTDAQEAAMGMLEFFDSAGDLGFSAGLDEVMDHLRGGLKVKATFHTPGEAPLTPKWLPGYRIYVLGPPKNEGALKDTGSGAGSDLYHIGIGQVGAGLSAALASVDGSQPDQCEEQMPFDPRFRQTLTNTWQFFPKYHARKNRWRCIGNDWLSASADLALQLDSITNNTSLALAIERISDGKVLLFPADAQEGNWLSWHDEKMKWSVTDTGCPPRQVTAKDLLARTVFYKVGHHASHNGTINEKGLELMKQEDELTAFIPVDRKIALGRSPKGSWRMPARALYRRLLEKCQGRVARSDLGWATDAAVAADRATEEEFKKLATPQEWAAWKKNQSASSRVTVNELYIEFRLD